VAWYRIGTDLSGNGNDLAAAGNVSTTTDRFGNASAASLFSPSGASDHTTAISGSNPLLPVGAAPRTVSVWLKTTTDFQSRGNAGAMWNWGTTATGERFGEMCFGPNNPEYFVGQNHDVVGNISINDGLWHNVVVTYDGHTVTQYVDGTLDLTGTPVLGTVGTAVVIGNSLFDHLPEPFNGAVDDLVVYDHVLTASELDQVFNSAL